MQGRAPLGFYSQGLSPDWLIFASSPLQKFEFPGLASDWIETATLIFSCLKAKSSLDPLG